HRDKPGRETARSTPNVATHRPRTNGSGTAPGEATPNRTRCGRAPSDVSGSTYRRRSPASRPVHVRIWRLDRWPDFHTPPSACPAVRHARVDAGRRSGGKWCALEYLGVVPVDVVGGGWPCSWPWLERSAVQAVNRTADLGAGGVGVRHAH